MNILLCDDEEFYREKIRETLTHIMEEEGIPLTLTVCADGSEVLVHCETEDIDGVILDIAMPGLSGFEVAEQLQASYPELPLLFFSNKEELVYCSYEYHPFWFVPKSRMSDLPGILRKFVQKIRELLDDAIYVEIMLKRSSMRIDLKRTLYFESAGHNVKMQEYNEKTTPFRARISDLERQLTRFHFVRCHEGFLINCRGVQELCHSYALMRDGREIPISRGRMNQTKSAFLRYLRSERL